MNEMTTAETVDAGLFPSWLDPMLKCLQCGATGLARGAAALVCHGCGAAYPVCNGVALLMGPDTVTDTAAVLAQHLGGVDPAAVQAAFGTALRYRLHDRTLRDEFTQIVERYATLFPETGGAAQAPAAPGTPGAAVLRTEYFNERFVPGETTFRSFRIANTGGAPLATEGPEPFHVSYWIEDAAGGRVEGVRSRLPIPLLPGRELTVPVRIVAPDTPGTYGIKVLIVQEYVGWHEDAPIYVGSMVVAPPGAAAGEGAGKAAGAAVHMIEAPHEGFFDFQMDLARCGEMLKLAVGMLRKDAKRAELAVLEVACGNDPQTLRHYQKGTRVVACDLAFPQIQLGALALRQEGRVPAGRYAFMAADVFNMPFPAGTFDLVVVCAALHHFTDVVVALQHLRGMLSPRGKLLLMREPGKVAPEDPTYIMELANGFNEQQFVPAEYETMFARAGLAVQHHRMDFECSYKVILERV